MPSFDAELDKILDEEQELIANYLKGTIDLRIEIDRKDNRILTDVSNKLEREEW